MKKCLLVFFLIIMFVPLLSSCWNQKEMTDLAFIMAMGVDKGHGKRFKVSFQIVDPGNVAAGQSGGGQGLPIAVYSSTGDTITEAARNATKMISRRLYYAHTNLVVVSESIAKKELLNILDALDRDPEFRTTTEMVVARNARAEDIVSTLTLLDKLPVNKIKKEIESTETMLGENMSVSVDDFLTGLVSSGKQPILNGYKLTGNKELARTASTLQKTEADAKLEADGMAVFRRGKLIGWIDHEDARGIIWILNKLKSTDINLTWNGKKAAVNMAPIRSKTKISAKINNGKPVINIKIADEGWISEANTKVDLTDPNEIKKIDEKTEKEIKKQIAKTVKAAQKLKSDIFGFGEIVHRKDPKLWKKIRNDWDNQFAKLEVNVKVDSNIRKEGIRTNPFWVDFKK